MKNLGHPTAYLAWTIRRHDRSPIHLSHPALIAKLIELSGLRDVNICNSALPKQPDFVSHSLPPPLSATDQLIYQSLLGDLRYLAASTHPDIAFATARLTHHIARPA